MQPPDLLLEIRVCALTMRPSVLKRGAMLSTPCKKRTESGVQVNDGRNISLVGDEGTRSESKLMCPPWITPSMTSNTHQEVPVTIHQHEVTTVRQDSNNAERTQAAV